MITPKDKAADLRARDFETRAQAVCSKLCKAFDEVMTKHPYQRRFSIRMNDCPEWSQEWDTDVGVVVEACILFDQKLKTAGYADVDFGLKEAWTCPEFTLKLRFL